MYPRRRSILLGKFLFKIMYFELKEGKLIKRKCEDGMVIDDAVLKNIYTKKIDEKHNLLIDTQHDKCYIINESAEKVGIPKEIYNEIIKPKESNKDSSPNKIVTFILAITYSCNLHCTYCYQQHDPDLNRNLISKADLRKVLDTIGEYMVNHPDKQVEMGLFGGEPLLVQNEEIIDEVFKFCKEKKIRVHITTNGVNLDYYLKKIIINRKIISSINPTIDSVKLNYSTRKNLNDNKNVDGETEKIIKCVKTLLYYKVPVNIATNVDRHNCKHIWETHDDFKRLGLMDDDRFVWSIGRVDDRLYETNYPDIIREDEIISELLKYKMPINMHAAFLKTTYNLVNKMGVDLHQHELKGIHNYCWNSSNQDIVFYIDNDLNTYRCTYTVGRPKYKIFDFSKEQIETYKIRDVTNIQYRECEECKIGGYCGGGCQLSHAVNFERCCQYEKETFENFVDNILISYIKMKLKEL